MVINIEPLPAAFRGLPERLRPLPPPLFPGCGPDGPTPADIALARELFLALDPESQRWYASCSAFAGLTTGST